MCSKTKEERRRDFLKERKERLAIDGKIMPPEEIRELQNLANAKKPKQKKQSKNNNSFVNNKK